MQKIKDTRDYSFLLSDDAEIPAPAKEPPPRNISARSSGTLLLGIMFIRDACLGYKNIIMTE